MQKTANAELLACRAGTARPASAAASESAAGSPSQGLATVAAVSNPAVLDGEWLTPDRTIVWQIQGNRAAIHSTGDLTGFVTGSASIALQGSSVSGTLSAATYYGLVMGSAAFQGQLQGEFINGSMRDESGAVQPFVLVKARPQ